MDVDLNVRIRGLWRLRVVNLMPTRTAVLRALPWAMDRLSVEVNAGRRPVAAHPVRWRLGDDGTVTAHVLGAEAVVGTLA